MLLTSSLYTFKQELFASNGSHDFWQEIRNNFPISSADGINLNNGSCGMIPNVVEEFMIQCMKEMNRKPPYVINEEWKESISRSVLDLATYIGAHEEEVALTRNTTEGLQWIIESCDIPKDSDVICAYHDYTLVKNALKKKCESSGAQLKILNIPLPATKEELIEAYKDAITDRCSMLIITPITHRMGHPMPVRELVGLAQERGATTVVDAAHCFGYIDHNVHEWDCDFYATSLHKWFNGPWGSGLLYAKKDRIKNLEGPLAADLDKSDTIVKFNYLGTRAFYLEAGISAAIEFNNTMVTSFKYNHLESLTQYWVNNLEDVSNINIIKPKKYGAFGSLYLEGYSGGKIKKALKEKGIYVKTIDRFDSRKTGIRVTPGIYTNTSDLDKFIEEIREIAKS